MAYSTFKLQLPPKRWSIHPTQLQGKQCDWEHIHNSTRSNARGQGDSTPWPGGVGCHSWLILLLAASCIIGEAESRDLSSVFCYCNIFPSV